MIGTIRCAYKDLNIRSNPENLSSTFLFMNFSEVDPLVEESTNGQDDQEHLLNHDEGVYAESGPSRDIILVKEEYDDRQAVKHIDH